MKTRFSSISLATALVFVSLSLASTSHADCVSLFSLARFDVNEDVAVDYAEFQKLALWRSNKLDRNRDGYLVPSEAAPGKVFRPKGVTLGKRIKIGSSTWRKGGRAFFDFIDRNGDGKLGLGEYNRLCNEGWSF